MSDIDDNEIIKVGIADDHVLFKKTLKLALSFYKDIDIVLDAENGLDLLSQLEKIRIDIILLDIRMSVMDGIASLAQIKKHYPNIKVIILSLNADPAMVSKLKEMGADAYLTKSMELPEMYTVIKNTMNVKYMQSSR